jgi:opacity protein-like surface antigen
MRWNYLTRFAALSLPLLAPAVCQTVSFGVKAGVPLTGELDAFQDAIDEGKRWTVGPTVEFRLPARLSLGVDALYREADGYWSKNVGSANFFNEQHVSIWEFPVYVKYRFMNGPVQPFVLGGMAFNYAKTTGRGGCSGGPTLCGLTPPNYEIRNSEWGVGFVMGGGVDFKVGRFTIAPELRYTRWERGYLSGAGPDQAALLVGFRF